MNLNLNYEGFEEYLVNKHIVPFNGGIGYKFKFDNRRGASVIKHAHSHGSDKDLWELVVLYWWDDEWEFDYDTPITNDIIGYLTDEDVRNLLQQIKDL